MKRTACLSIILALLTCQQVLAAQNPEKDMGEQMKAIYKGKQLVVMVEKMYAGEFKKDAFGPRYDGVAWHHFHESAPMRGGRTPLDQLDDRTVALRGTGIIAGNGVGTNTFLVEKGETLLVSDVAFGCGGDDCQLMLYLNTFKLSRASSLDPRKATRPTAGSAVGLERAGLGCQFIFHFGRATVVKMGQKDAVIAAVGKYLLPSGEAETQLKAENNVEINLGATEEEVIKKLGEPVKSVRVGPQKTLRYKDMAIILRDGKVVDVKVE